MSEDKQCTYAECAPLGLFAFGVSTVLLNIHNAGFFEMSPAIMMMGIFYGGSTQFIAGLLSFKRGSTFDVAAFTSFGAFWLTLVGIWLAPYMGLPAANSQSMGYYFLLWALFTTGLIFGTIHNCLANKLVFITLAILFYLLSWGSFAENPTIIVIAGYEGALCGLTAWYLALGIVLKSALGRDVLPFC